MILLAIPVSFIQEHFLLSWKEVLWGYRNFVFDQKDVVTMAMDAVQSTTHSRSPQYQLEMELAGLLKSELHEVEPLLLKLSVIDSNSTDVISEKWLYIILLWLYDNRSNTANVQDIIDTLYADFDFSELIEPLVGYMPSYDTEDILKAAEWFVRRDCRWKRYLDEYAFYRCTP